MITMLFSNVSMSQLDCMRRECCCMMRHHAKKYGYTIVNMMFPAGNQATWCCKMCKNGKVKKMVMRVYHDPVTCKLMVQCSQNMMSDSAMKEMMHHMHQKC